MKRPYLIRYLGILVFACSLFLSSDALCHHHESGEKAGNKMYTAYNIWIWPAHNMICLNYKGARNRIPIGTEVKKIQTVDFTLYYPSNNDAVQEGIEFTIAESGKTYAIGFIPSYHPGATTKDYRRWMFTPKTVDELTGAFTPYEIAAIKEGVIAQGMRKDAVLACFGPPSERHTRGLDNNTWVYFIKKKEHMKIHFSKNPETGLEEVQQIDLIAGRRNRIGLTNYPRPVSAVQKPKPKPQVQPQPMLRQTDDVEYKLKKIKQLYEKGLITEEEYKKKRQQIMDDF